MSSQLHHVVMCSHSANDFVTFLTGVVGMTIQQQFHVPGDLLESTLGWPRSSGTQVTMVGSGDCGLIEVLDVPAPLREAVPEGLAALSFLSDDAGRVRERRRRVGTRQKVDRYRSARLRAVLLQCGRCADRVHGRLFGQYRRLFERRDEPLSPAARRCAIAIRDAVQALGIEVRAGLHTGECEVRGDDIGGIAVHIGARVSALAGPNDVLVSSTLRDLVIGSGLEFEDRGAHQLKGVPGEWHLFAVASP